VDFSKLTQGEKIVLGAGLLLIIDLLFLPWHKIDIGSVLGVRVPEVTATGVEAPNGGYGILAVLIAVVMVGQIIAAKFTTAKLPNPPVPWPQVHLYAGIAVAGVILLKLLVETDFLAFGAFLGVLLAGAVAYGGFMISKEPRTTPGII
jgi:hypothetical protein